MADLVVHGRAHALRIPLVAQVGRDAAVLHRVVVHPAVYLARRGAHADAPSHVVEHADVDGRAALDALDVVRRLQQPALGQLAPLFVQLLEALVEDQVAFLVLAPAAAPAYVVATGLLHSVIHAVSFRSRAIVPRTAASGSGRKESPDNSTVWIVYRR